MTGMGVSPVLPKDARGMKHVAGEEKGVAETKDGKGCEAEPALLILAVKACVSGRLLEKTIARGQKLIRSGETSPSAGPFHHPRQPHPPPRQQSRGSFSWGQL